MGCLLSVIVVEYFSRPHLDHLVDSIRNFEPALPVWISSNSHYGSREQEQLSKEFPDLKWLHHGENLGYAGGVNRALARVETPYVAILNPDVELIEPLVEKTMAIFEANPRLAIFGPLVLDGDKNATCSFRRFYPPRYIFARYLGIVPNRLRQHFVDHYLMVTSPRDQFTYADWISGGAMFVRMDAVRESGSMDERYFLYMEDVDWCRNFWSSGWFVSYQPEITVIHRAQHQTTRGGLRNAFSRATRNHLTSYVKYLMKWGLAPFHPADKHNI